MSIHAQSVSVKNLNTADPANADDARKMKTDLKTLAKSLGLSMTTVSRAINGYSDVSEKTRERVLIAAREMDYKPHPAARRLASGRSDAVGFVIPRGAGGAFSDPFYGELLAGIGARLDRDEVDLTVFAADQDASEMRIYRRLVDRRRVDGVIVAFTRRHDERVDYLLSTDMPFVVFGRTETDQPYAWLDIDNLAGFRDATRHLLANGHRRVALVNYPTSLNFAHLRLTGYREALTEFGIAFDPSLVREGEMTEATGREHAASLLDMNDPPTAILCASYSAGTGVRLELRSRGLDTPRDLSLIVFVDSPSATPDPGLSVLRQPISGCGIAAADMLTRLIAKEVEASALHQLWAPEPAFGRSDGPPPTR